jgi:hypothetical protein
VRTEGILPGMRRRLIVLTAVLGALLTLGGVAGGASATTHARLRLMDADPITFRGTGFKAHERVRVVVMAGTRATKRTTASLRGVFVVRFSGLDPNACSAFGATAVGNKGSQASFKRSPGMCPLP